MTRLMDIQFKLGGRVVATSREGTLDPTGLLRAELFVWTGPGSPQDYLPTPDHQTVFFVKGVVEHKSQITRNLAFASIQGDWKTEEAIATFNAPRMRATRSGRSTRSDFAGAFERPGTLPLEYTPNNLVPDFADYPDEERAYYRKAILTPPQAADPLTNPRVIEAPLALDSVDGQHGIDLPVVGMMLNHVQHWKRRHMALGNLLHSLTLAPGEATRVAVHDWTHRSRGIGEEDTTQRDASQAGQSQSRALQEIQDSVARESQHGASANAAKSSSLQGGFSLFGFSASAAHSHTVATAVSSTAASREVGANENQQVHQAAEQHAQASRSRRAAVIREANEADSDQVTTRIVANYNHMHAMTVQYFEVVEVYEVTTRIASHQPCIFVPMALLEGAQLLEKYPSTVADAAQAAGMDQIARRIRGLSADMPLRTDSEGVEATVAAAKQAISDALKTVSDIKGLAGELQGVGVRMVPRILPPPPVEPWNDADTAEVRRLASSVSSSSQAGADLLAASTANLDALLLAQQDAELTEEEGAVRAKLSRRINEYLEYFNQAVWLQELTPRKVHLLLKDRIFAGEILNDIIDPNPVAISGNLVAFPLASDHWLAGAGQPPSVNFENSTTSEIAIPTGGVFAEAVHGQAVSAERIDLTRFWDWQESPIPLVPTEINAVNLAHAAIQPNLSAGKLSESAAQLGPLTAMPEPTGLADIIGTLSASNMFRNMSGLEAAKEIALAASNHAATGAVDAAANATQSFKDFAEFAEKVIPMIMTDGASSIIGGQSNLKSDEVPFADPANELRDVAGDEDTQADTDLDRNE